MINYWRVIQSREEEMVNQNEITVYFKEFSKNEKNEMYHIFNNVLYEEESKGIGSYIPSQVINMTWMNIRKRKEINTFEKMKNFWLFIRKPIMRVCVRTLYKHLDVCRVKIKIPLLTNNEIRYLQSYPINYGYDVKLGFARRKDLVENLLGYSIEGDEYLDILETFCVPMPYSDYNPITDINPIWFRMIDVLKAYNRNILCTHKHMRRMILKDIATKDCIIRNWYPFNIKKDISNE